MYVHISFQIVFILEKRDIFHDCYILCIYTFFSFYYINYTMAKVVNMICCIFLFILYTFQNAYFYDVWSIFECWGYDSVIVDIPLDIPVSLK